MEDPSSSSAPARRRQHQQPPPTTKPLLQECQVLVWPQSCQKQHGNTFNPSAVATGLVVGWRIPHPSSVGRRSLRTAVVAGILPLPDELLHQTSLPNKAVRKNEVQQKIRQLQDQLQQQKQQYCSCCTTTRQGNDDSYPQRPSSLSSSSLSSSFVSFYSLLNSLEVLAIYGDEKDTVQKLSTTTISSLSDTERVSRRSIQRRALQQPSPTMATIYPILQNDKYIPWIDGWDDTSHHSNHSLHAGQRQIIYYDDSGQTCFLQTPQDESKTGTTTTTLSSVWGDILVCISYAPQIMNSLVQHGTADTNEHAGIALHSTTPPTTKAKGIASSNQNSKITASSKNDGNTIATNKKAYFNILRYSFTLQLFLRCYQGPDQFHWQSIRKQAMRQETDIVCQDCGKIKWPADPVKKLRQSVEFWNGILRSCFDLALGFLFLFFLNECNQRKLLSCATIRMWIQAESRLIQEGTRWLETFPIGFKLNEPLTQSLGREIRFMVAAYEQLIFHIIQLFENYWISQIVQVILVVVTSTLGASGLCVVLIDVFRLAHMRLWILVLAFQKVFQCELYLLAVLWRVFRGKKRNILRDRTDSMQYDSIQLLLGSILFAIALFLFTTILVYHAFFAICVVPVSAVLALPSMAFIWLRQWPAGILVMRCVYRQWYTRDFYLIEDDCDIPLTSTTILCTMEDGLGKSITDVALHTFSKVFRSQVLQFKCSFIGSENESMWLNLMDY